MNEPTGVPQTKAGRHWTPAAVESQIADLLDRLAWEAAAALGQDPYDDTLNRIPSRAAMYAAQLCGDDPRLASAVAQDVSRWARPTTDSDWLGTPLGRAVAASFGADEDPAVEVTHAEAARLLGVSRGRIGQLVTARQLARGPRGSVLRSSVGQLMAERAVRDGDLIGRNKYRREGEQ